MKAVGYCRYSTDNQTENSIAYQLNAIQKYCEAHNFVLLNAYTDEATSGTNTNREGLQRMLEDSKRHVFDVVVIYDQSRLSRNVLDWFEMRESLRNSDIQLHSCTERLEDPENGGAGFLSEGVRALFNHQFVLDSRAKTIAGQSARARQGAFLGGTPPLGYDIVDGRYTINTVEADAVRFIFENYAVGKGYGFIIDKLKEMGTKSKRGAIIGHNALYAILRNERYIGVYSWMKTKEKYLKKWAGGKPNPNAVRITEGIIPPIVEKDVWDMVQKRAGDQKKNATNRARNEYLLSGLLQCGICGSAFVGFTNRNQKGYETRYYSCGGKRRLHNCPAKNINANELEVLAVSQVERDILNNVIIERVADDIMAAYRENCGDSSAIKREIMECEKGIKNLLSAVAKGLDAELAMEKVDDLKIKKNTLELQFAEFVAEMPERENILKVLKADVELLKQDRHGNLRAMLKKYITSITIFEDTLEIHCLGDLFEKPQKRVTSPDNSDDVTTTGCGGEI